jgi:hypothetical protein
VLSQIEKSKDKFKKTVLKFKSDVEDAIAHVKTMDLFGPLYPQKKIMSPEDFTDIVFRLVTNAVSSSF